MKNDSWLVIRGSWLVGALLITNRGPQIANHGPRITNHE